MNVKDAVRNRRASRSLDPAPVTEDLIRDLAGCASLAPSCFNNQPSRFVFVHQPEMLERMFEALSEGNQWARRASMIAAVFSREEDDCVIRDRKYHQFDCGLAAAFLILRAVELGLVAHPIAGFSPKKTREILGIPDEYSVISLIIFGKKAGVLHPELSDDQRAAEKNRPKRKALRETAFFNRFSGS